MFSAGSAPVAAVPSAYSADADELDALERELGLDIGMSSALKAEPAVRSFCACVNILCVNT